MKKKNHIEYKPNYKGLNYSKYSQPTKASIRREKVKIAFYKAWLKAQRP